MRKFLWRNEEETMELIVAVSEDWRIGKDGNLLFSIPEDMKFFRQTTQGKTVVMGRKTLESLPGGKPLKNRQNIVLTRNEDWTAEGVQVCHTVDEVCKAVESLDPSQVMVIGGAEIYRQMLSLCDRAYVTRVFAQAPADSFFPNLEDKSDWKLESQSEEREHEGLRYRFCTYVRCAPAGKE